MVKTVEERRIVYENERVEKEESIENTLDKTDLYRLVHKERMSHDEMFELLREKIQIYK